MPVWKTAFLVLLLAVPRLALAEEDSDLPELHDDEASTDEEPMDGDEFDPKGIPPEEELTSEDGLLEDVPLEDLLTPEQLQKLHTKMDADTNSKLSLDEILTFYRHTQRSAAAADGKNMMEGIDGDKDGKISLRELMADMDGEDDDEADRTPERVALRKKHQAREAHKFKAADGNSDGFLDEAELAAFFNPDVHDNVLQVVAQHTMEDHDRDKDGVLTFDEFGEEMQMFKKLDKDGNDKLDMEELLVWESGHIHNVEVMDKFVQIADTNGDQHVTINELHVAHKQEANEAREHFMEMVKHHEATGRFTEMAHQHHEL